MTCIVEIETFYGDRFEAPFRSPDEALALVDAIRRTNGLRLTGAGHDVFVLCADVAAVRCRPAFGMTPFATPAPRAA